MAKDASNMALNEVSWDNNLMRWLRAVKCWTSSCLKEEIHNVTVLQR